MPRMKTGEGLQNRCCIEAYSRHTSEMGRWPNNIAHKVMPRARRRRLTFFLQLVSYLKSIGTVPAIDINAYLKAIHAEIDEDI